MASGGLVAARLWPLWRAPPCVGMSAAGGGPVPETQAPPEELDAKGAAVAVFKDAMAWRRWQGVASNGRERTVELQLLLMHHKIST